MVGRAVVRPPTVRFRSVPAGCNEIAAAAGGTKFVASRRKKTLCVQDLGNLARELVERERLGDEADAGLDGPVMHDCVAGIAGGEQNLDVRAALPHLVR